MKAQAIGAIVAWSFAVGCHGPPSSSPPPPPSAAAPVQASVAAPSATEPPPPAPPSPPVAAPVPAWALAAVHDWDGDRGYATFHGPDAGVFELEVREGTLQVEPTQRLEGSWPVFSSEAPPRSGRRVVLRRDGGLFLNHGDGRAATPLPGQRAWFYAGGEQLVTAGDRTLTLVDAKTGAVTKTIEVKHAITHGEVLGHTFLSVCGGVCPQGDGSVLRVDLKTHAVEVDAVAPFSARSRSGRWLATLENRMGPGDAGVLAALVVRDARNGHRPRETSLGHWPAETLTVEIDRGERWAVISEAGLAGAGMFTARRPRSAVSLANGAKVPAPPVSALYPFDVVERSEQVLPALRRWPRPPRTLVGSMRGPGGSNGFAESSDARLVVALTGIVESGFGALRVKAPHALVVDRPARLRHRIPLPVAPEIQLVRLNTGIGAGGRVAWTCLDGSDGSTAVILLDLKGGKANHLGALDCVNLVRSADSNALWEGATIIDLPTQRRLSVVATPP